MGIYYKGVISVVLFTTCIILGFLSMVPVDPADRVGGILVFRQREDEG